MFYPYQTPEKRAMLQASIDKERVIRACKNFIAMKDRKYTEKIDEAVAQLMKPHTGIFAAYKQWRYPTPKTREEAIAIMKRCDSWGFSWMDEIKSEGAYWYRRAERMLVLAEASTTGFVVLDTDGEWILKYES